MINIELINQNDEVAYQDFLTRNSHSLFYYSLQYRNLLQDLLQIEALYFVAKRGNEIVASFPIMIKQNLNFGPIANSLPYYGSNGSILIDNSLDENEKNDLNKKMLATVIEQLSHKKLSAYTFITNPLDKSSSDLLESNLKYDFIDYRIGQITALPPNSDDLEADLLKTFENPRPRNIRKARKSNVTFYSSNSQEDLDFLYKTHEDNILAINGIPKKKIFFNSIKKYIDNDTFRIYIAKIDDVKISALLLFYKGKTVEYFTPATIHDYRNMQPSSLLIFEAMKDAIKLGYQNWNWGGTWESQKGVYDFKRKWGANDFKYFYYTKINNQELLNQSPATLVNEYENFFVVNFKELSQDETN